MKEITKYLHRFLSSEFFKKNDFWKSHAPSFSGPSVNIIKNIFEKIEESDIAWLSESNIEKETELDFSSEEMKTHWQSNPCDYISDEINESVKQANKIGYQYIFYIGKKKIIVYLTFPFAKEDPIHKVSVNKMKLFFQECIRKIYMWLNIAYTQSDSHCANELKIYIYFSEFFKLLPEKDTGILSRENANTAYTTSCMQKINIHVCRQEEWFKVFIHETFHCLGLDFSHRSDLAQYAKARILDIYNVTSEVNLFEAYCETFANILNTAFYVYDLSQTSYQKMTESRPPPSASSGSSASSASSYSPSLSSSPSPSPSRSSSSSHSIENKIQMFLECMNYEAVFSYLQTVKILHFYGISYRTLIDRSGECDLEKSFFKEDNTNILSYYIIKMICICYLDEYLLECRQMNGEDNIFHFKESVENIDKYVDFIRSKHNAEYLLECIDRMQYWHMKQEDYCKLEHRTMRLSIFE
jgi:hypothetical protein